MYARMQLSKCYTAMNHEAEQLSGKRNFDEPHFLFRILDAFRPCGSLR